MVKDYCEYSGAAHGGQEGWKSTGVAAPNNDHIYASARGAGRAGYKLGDRPDCMCQNGMVASFALTSLLQQQGPADQDSARHLVQVCLRTVYLLVL